MPTTRPQILSAIDDAALAEGIVLDDSQRQLVHRLADLDVTTQRRRRPCPRGLYVYGSAGRGKSWLANAFYDAAPTPRKIRIHFHSFFDDLHRHMHTHRHDPSTMRQALDDVIGQSQLLYFDELHVHDSGDARLLTRMLEHVLTRRVTILATSNYAPEDLLPNPIWHHIFEPGIDLIKTHFDIHHLAGHTDYRAATRSGTSAGFSNSDWTSTAPTQELPYPSELPMLTVGSRDFSVLAVRDNQLFVSFPQLCDSPLSTIEYLNWARTYTRWTILDIPEFACVSPEAQQRFINLIDILVDTDVQVTFVSAHTLTAFLDAASPRPDAFRMASRLQLLRRHGQAHRASTDVL
ncbi:cell division protein ZapE [Williamsia sp. 1138]|uniref:cell division protein ZapE n=1 Tax=Williamsia sp. 1138 TaxID=1903117 RepID=UPI000A0FAEE2|nr:cell division protein ZapE [Williamsia sp. 1138]OZG27400.1 cell division protein ZapE [Williamsia sp. 1138]